MRGRFGTRRAMRILLAARVHWRLYNQAVPESDSKIAPPTIAVSMGDPRGIGPEVIVKALADDELRTSARWMILGWAETMARAAKLVGMKPFWETAWHPIDLPRNAPVGVVDLADRTDPGEVSFIAVECAIESCIIGMPQARALVTGPISKEAWADAGFSQYPGHTELLIERLAGEHPELCRMGFIAPMLRVMLVTTHIPLSKVPGALTVDRVANTIRAAHRVCVDLGVAHPRIGVCGVNPHAGEHDLLGDDETRVILPAIEQTKHEGIDAQGPFPGDTIFRDAINFRKLDIVVAMYHDQGLIPIKTLAFDSAVNMTTGLRVPRTSPDHGTAFDIAWRGIADAGSMTHAMRLAVRLASHRSCRTTNS